MNIGVIGAGGWGTALAILLAEKEHHVGLWQFEADQVQQMIQERENAVYLPGVEIPKQVLISSDLSDVVSDRDMVVFAVPCQFARLVARKAAPMLAEHAIVVNVAKGIENKTLKRMSELLLEEIGGLTPERVATLSGPSHAEEVSRKIPTTVVAGSKDRSTAERIQDAFMTPTFRVYTNSDLVGVELGGALKNVIALASGICDGLGFGDNTKGALLTRGAAEITRLGTAMGACAETFAGLSGMGDLITTCISPHSRNRHVGEKIGKGESLDEVMGRMGGMVAEGVPTTRSTYRLAQELQVEMPITNQMYSVLFEGKTPQDAVFDLMVRDAKPEVWA
ncbi:MAG: NAD(P)H-dependent glycerol-3-phosphate dehydrogenase [Candidatus Latescibacterota bacterium]